MAVVVKVKKIDQNRIFFENKGEGLQAPKIPVDEVLQGVWDSVIKINQSFEDAKMDIEQL